MMDGRKTLIVGASRGLGAGLVEALARRGWTVTATVRKEGTTVPAAAAVEIVDIDDPGSVSGLHERLSGSRFDLVFVNAGVMSASPDAPIHEERVEEALRVFRTNAISPVAFAEAFRDRLAAHGRIALMSSILGSVSRNTNGGNDSYRASKAALNTLARSFSARHPDLGVLVVHPGWVRTDMGGRNAHLDVETSANAMADMLEKRADQRGAVFVDWENREIPW